VHLTLNLLLGKQQAVALASHGLPLNRLMLDQPASQCAGAEAPLACNGQEPSSSGQEPGSSSGSGGGGGSAAAVTWRQLAEHGIILQVGMLCRPLVAFGCIRQCLTGNGYRQLVVQSKQVSLPCL